MENKQIPAKATAIMKFRFSLKRLLLAALHAIFYMPVKEHR
jgi:hypothetical protein